MNNKIAIDFNGGMKIVSNGIRLNQDKTLAGQIVIQKKWNLIINAERFFQDMIIAWYNDCLKNHLIINPEHNHKRVQ